MANPGEYLPYASDAIWPFLAFVGALLFVPLLGFATLMVVKRHVSRSRWAAAAVLALAIATVSIGGLITADSNYREAETAHRIAYAGQVSAWLGREYGLDLTEAELSEVWTPQGTSGQFRGATAYLTVRGDRDTGRLVVTDRSGAQIDPIEE
jgi:hypothetical protein